MSRMNKMDSGSGNGPLAFLRSVYEVGNLDTRFTTPSSVPYRSTIDARGGGQVAAKADPKAKPSRWATPEFWVYYLVFLVVIPYMFWVAYDVSRRMAILPSTPILLGLLANRSYFCSIRSAIFQV